MTTCVPESWSRKAYEAALRCGGKLDTRKTPTSVTHHPTNATTTLAMETLTRIS